MDVNEQKTVAFIVLNYNDDITTMTLVDALSKWPKNKINIRIIVVDNVSTDGSMERLNKRYINENNVDVVSSEYNGGYSYGNNYGGKYAIRKYQPQYIAIANPDIQIDYHTFEKLLQTFEEEDSIAACAPVMMDLAGNYGIRTQNVPGYLDDLQACINENKVKTVNKQGFKCVNDVQNMLITQMLPGSFFVIRTDCWQQVDFFDEGVFLFCEERILGKKLLNAGYKQVLRSDLFFTHAHSVSIKKSYDIIKTWKLIMKSRLYYQQKYNNITSLKKNLLKVAMLYFVLKLRLNMMISKWRRKITNNWL